jgi:toxin ParE1/3/4
MVQIRWTDSATSELLDIYGYISKDSILYAKRQLLSIRKRTQLLKKHKYSGKIVEEIQNPTIRELIEGHYRIIYKIINENEVVILTVHHSARDLTSRSLE